MSVLELEGITKSYGSSRALDDVSLTVQPGRVHALVGENGAGKSTLIKVMSGIVQPDAGSIRLNGEALHLDTRHAAGHAIHVVHQDFALFDDLTVTENVFVGHELRRGERLDRQEMRARAVAALGRLSADLDPEARVGGLSTAGKQLVEIARGLVHDVNVLLLDEPTAALSAEPAEALFETLRTLVAEGCGIVYVSHRLTEVMELADEITVLKDGRHVATREADSITVDEVVSLMVGRDVGGMFPPKVVPAKREPCLRVGDLVDPPKLHGVSLEVMEGEIVGIYGLEGSGQDELLGCLSGDRRPVRGSLELFGTEGGWRSLAKMLGAGVGYVPRDRKEEGLLLEQSSIVNVTFPIERSLSRLGFISRALQKSVSTAAAEAAGVVGDLFAPVSDLSGGNQQKALLARLVAARCRLLLLNQPTRGVDVGSKEEIYALIARLCREDGAGALITSPELSELLGLCDRVLVLAGGRIAGEAPPDATEEQLLGMAVAG